MQPARTRPLFLLLLCLLAIVVPASYAPAQNANETKALQAEIDALLKRDDGPAILSYAEARTMVADLKKTSDAITEDRKKLAKLPAAQRAKLDVDDASAKRLIDRAKAWAADTTWPLNDAGVNPDYADWVTASESRIRGQRILVRAPGSSEWRWRILVNKNSRRPSVMRDWLVKHASDKSISDAEWNKRYPKADRAAAKDGKVPSGWHIHHVVPLYVGDANGGKDAADNYILVRDAVHRSLHSSSGATFKRWGSPRLYVKRGEEYKDIDDTGDD